MPPKFSQTRQINNYGGSDDRTRNDHVGVSNRGNQTGYSLVNRQGRQEDNPDANQHGPQNSTPPVNNRGNRGDTRGGCGNRNGAPPSRDWVNRGYTPEPDYNERATQRRPRTELLTDPNEPLTVDIEFQNHYSKSNGKTTVKIGRIAVINTHGQTIYDTYVRYDYDDDIKVKLPAGFPVCYPDLRICNGAQWIRIVYDDLHVLFRGRRIVGHGTSNDRKALGEELLAVAQPIWDTQNSYGQKRLCYLMDEYFPLNDFSFHDPVHDAQATMLLYLRLHPYHSRTGFPYPQIALQENDSEKSNSTGNDATENDSTETEPTETEPTENNADTEDRASNSEGAKQGSDDEGWEAVVSKNKRRRRCWV